jgi:hypothetical protein
MMNLILLLGDNFEEELGGSNIDKSNGFPDKFLRCLSLVPNNCYYKECRILGCYAVRRFGGTYCLINRVIRMAS